MSALAIARGVRASWRVLRHRSREWRNSHCVRKNRAPAREHSILALGNSSQARLIRREPPVRLDGSGHENRLSGAPHKLVSIYQEIDIDHPGRPAYIRLAKRRRVADGATKAWTSDAGLVVTANRATEAAFHGCAVFRLSGVGTALKSGSLYEC